MNNTIEQVDGIDPNWSPDTIPKDERTEWKKLSAKIRSVRLVRDSVKLRKVRDDAIEMKKEFQDELSSLENRQDSTADVLDKLANTEEIKSLQKRIDTINAGLGSIQSRAENLAMEADQSDS